MSIAHSMNLVDVPDQTGQEDSFVGGRPKLPPSASVPECKLCGARQTFFFQVAFPDDHAWSGFTVAVFACTSCADEDHLIPEMLVGVLRGADVPKEFLIGYQRNFRLQVFPTNGSQIVHAYRESIKFYAIKYDWGDGMAFGQIGGSPQWVLDDESPRAYDSTTPMQFLLQVKSGFRFECIPGAPPQVEVGLGGESEPSPDSYYRLFIGNTMYFFGPVEPRQGAVYALTQVP